MTLKKRLLASFLLVCNILFVNAQDNKVIAYNKSTVSVNAMEMMSRTYNYEHPSADIYDDWNNIYVHAKTETVPNSYKVDLRDFSMPIEHNFITSDFGYRPKFKRNHYGVDIKAYLGDTVRAAFSGKVRVVKETPNGYGKVIVIRHYNGLETVYGHLSKQIVKVDEHVEAGQPIGLAGNTGRSTGPHLHFETRLCGLAINPNQLFSFKMRDVVGDFYFFKK